MLLWKMHLTVLSAKQKEPYPVRLSNSAKFKWGSFRKFMISFNNLLNKLYIHKRTMRLFIQIFILRCLQGLCILSQLFSCYDSLKTLTTIFFCFSDLHLNTIFLSWAIRNLDSWTRYSLALGKFFFPYKRGSVCYSSLRSNRV